ncbi:MAG: PEP-CTERM sorting domain-containing protein [Pirellulaceae bacterium]
MTGDVTLSAVPEPNTALLSALGFLAFTRLRKRAA